MATTTLLFWAALGLLSAVPFLILLAAFLFDREAVTETASQRRSSCLWTLRGRSTSSFRSSFSSGLWTLQGRSPTSPRSSFSSYLWTTTSSRSSLFSCLWALRGRSTTSPLLPTTEPSKPVSTIPTATITVPLPVHLCTPDWVMDIMNDLDDGEGVVAEKGDLRDLAWEKKTRGEESPERGDIILERRRQDLAWRVKTRLEEKKRQERMKGLRLAMSGGGEGERTRAWTWSPSLDVVVE